MGILALNVDPDYAMRRRRTRLLRQVGFAVQEARTGTEAVALASAEPPHLIVLAVRLPDADGFDVCRRIKTNASTSAPVICISDHFELDELARSRASGADGYLAEPVDPSTFLDAIRELVAALRKAEEQGQRLAETLLSGMDFLQASRQRLDRTLGDLRALVERPWNVRSECVLIVDDEPLVRDLIDSVLAGDGYSVLQAGTAERAIEICMEQSPWVDLLVVDAGMPGRLGLERVWIQAKPLVRILYISGDHFENLEERGISPSSDFLPKPFTLPALLRKVREVLDFPRRMTATP